MFSKTFYDWTCVRHTGLLVIVDTFLDLLDQPWSSRSNGSWIQILLLRYLVLQRLFKIHLTCSKVLRFNIVGNFEYLFLEWIFKYSFWLDLWKSTKICNWLDFMIGILNNHNKCELIWNDTFLRTNTVRFYDLQFDCHTSMIIDQSTCTVL